MVRFWFVSGSQHYRRCRNRRDQWAPRGSNPQPTEKGAPSSRAGACVGCIPYPIGVSSGREGLVRVGRLQFHPAKFRPWRVPDRAPSPRFPMLMVTGQSQTWDHTEPRFVFTVCCARAPVPCGRDAVVSHRQRRHASLVGAVPVGAMVSVTAVLAAWMVQVCGEACAHTRRCKLGQQRVDSCGLGSGWLVEVPPNRARSGVPYCASPPNDRTVRPEILSPKFQAQTCPAPGVRPSVQNG